MSTKNSNGFRAGLRALTNPAHLPDFAPGEYDEEWEQARRFQRDFMQEDPFDAAYQRSVSEDLRLGGKVWLDEQLDTYLDEMWGDEPLTVIKPLELDESRFNWKNFTFFFLCGVALVGSQVLIAIAVEAAR